MSIALEDGVTPRRTVSVQLDGSKEAEEVPLLSSGEGVRGTIAVEVGKRVEHSGLSVELVGEIASFYDHAIRVPILSLGQSLGGAGLLEAGVTVFPFDLGVPALSLESFVGNNVRVRYVLRVSVDRGRVGSAVHEEEVWVHVYSPPPAINNSIKMEVGIEESLHIEFEYSSSKYHLRDVIVGKVYFLLVSVPIKFMEIALTRTETSGTGPTPSFVDNVTIAKFEIMDGAPVHGESVPVRFFLGGFPLTPTYHEGIKVFSVRYYLNLVLIDASDRRYYKQQEIVLWRKDPRRVSRTRRRKLRRRILDAPESSSPPPSSSSSSSSQAPPSSS